MENKRKYQQKDIKFLYGKAAGRCSFADCRMELILAENEKDGLKQIGEMAHIRAHSPNGPRATNEHDGDLNCYDNLILLCPTHHTKVDSQPNTYTYEILRKIKEDHEQWVITSLDQGMSEVGFAELKIASEAILESYHNVMKNDFTIVAPKEKMEKNGLTQKSYSLITMGLSKSHEVKEFISKIVQVDIKFADRLKEGFKKKYNELKQILRGDELFDGMFEFSKNGSSDFKKIAASLAILCHLFEICELFEK